MIAVASPSIHAGDDPSPSKGSPAHRYRAKCRVCGWWSWETTERPGTQLSPDGRVGEKRWSGGKTPAPDYLPLYAICRDCLGLR